MRAAATVGASVVVAVVLAASLGIPAGDTAIVVVSALVGSLLAALVGAVAMRIFGHRSLRAHEVAVALTGSGAVAGGALAAAIAMFLSTHDLEILLVVLVVGVGAGVASALSITARVGAGIERLAGLARRFEEGDDNQGRSEQGTVAELAAVEDELRDARQRLAEAHRRQSDIERSRRELVAWVSHDLRSPLASIRAMAEALEDQVVADEASVRRYHRSIRGESERLSSLVDDLFELSRITSGSLELRRVDVALEELLSDAVGLAGPTAEVRGIELRLALEQEVRVEVSPAELSRVLHNLLDNAIRHTPSGGFVLVQSRLLGEHVEVDVVDRCGGIPVDDLDRVFDVAFRGDASRGRNGGGGLGLAIAKGLVEAHHGTIDVGNHHQGCRFTVRLPVST